MNTCEFSIGQFVVYGTQGLCTVEDVKTISLSPTLPAQEYYILRQLSRNSIIYVPIYSESGKSKIRNVITRERIEEILSELHGRNMDWNYNRKERINSFREILSNGINCEMILMIRCIYLQKKKFYEAKKKLSASDDEMLRTAERIVNEEFAYVLGIREDEVGDYIRSKIEE